MTVRWKLNLSVAVLIGVFLSAAGVSIWAVSENAEQTRHYARMREYSQFTADIRTHLYQHLIPDELRGPRAADDNTADWPQFALQDIDVQIRLAGSEEERKLWKRVREAVAQLGTIAGDSRAPALTGELLARVERDLWQLRTYYDEEQYDSIKATANASLMAQIVIGAASLLTVLLFLVYLIMVRDWLVKPVEALERSAEAIGRGELAHRVPLTGRDELTQLARTIEAMADNLARHQATLLATRELTALGELSANVAHGLRNPLAAIRTTAQLAEQRGLDPHRAHAVIQEIARQADKIDQRISRLFEFSRPIELRRRATTFAELAAAAEAQACPLLEAKGMTLRTEDLAGSRVWRIDRDRMAAALAELVTNAVHHSPAGSEVIVRGESVSTGNGAAEALRVAVSDRGAGMSPATCAKVFDLFFTSRADGTGMGLTLVQRLVEQHGGRIHIASAPGEGTSIMVTVPADGPPAVSPLGALPEDDIQRGSAQPGGISVFPGTG